jgi:hypothetical protein
MIDRTWYVQAQLATQAPDRASAQAAMEAAMTAIEAALAPLTPQTWISAESQDGQFVFIIN